MNCAVWIFGRGASVACNLRWVVPSEGMARERSFQVEKIKAAVRKEMDQSTVDTEPYKLLLSALSRRTAPGWQHRFVTTNWDYLLQREISWRGFKVLPSWLEDSHVFHLNGTVEDSPGAKIPEVRSSFLLETDQGSDRTATVEFDRTLKFIEWRRHFVVIGMSFSCQIDRAFLALLHRARDSRSVGHSSWHVVNLSEEANVKVCDLIKEALPGANVTASQKGFRNFVIDGMDELARWGVLASAQHG